MILLFAKTSKLTRREGSKALSSVPEPKPGGRDDQICRRALAHSGVHLEREPVGETKMLMAERRDLLRTAKGIAVASGASGSATSGSSSSGVVRIRRRRKLERHRLSEEGEKEVRTGDEESIAAGQRRELGSRRGLGLRTSLRLARTWLRSLHES